MSPLCFALVTQNVRWPSRDCKVTFQQARQTGRRIGSVGRLPAGMSEERRGCLPPPLLPSGLVPQDQSSNLQCALLKARC